MKNSELIKKLNLEVLSQSFDDNEISGCYAGDLLSLCMSSIESNNIWLTVQTNINILGIASLCEVSSVIICQNMNVSYDVVKKAREEKISLLRSDKTVYELSNLIGECI